MFDLLVHNQFFIRDIQGYGDVLLCAAVCTFQGLTMPVNRQNNAQWPFHLSR